MRDQQNGEKAQAKASALASLCKLAQRRQPTPRFEDVHRYKLAEILPPASVKLVRGALVENLFVDFSTLTCTVFQSNSLIDLRLLIRFRLDKNEM